MKTALDFSLTKNVPSHITSIYATITDKNLCTDLRQYYTYLARKNPLKLIKDTQQRTEKRERTFSFHAEAAMTDVAITTLADEYSDPGIEESRSRVLIGCVNGFSNSNIANNQVHAIQLKSFSP